MFQSLKTYVFVWRTFLTVLTWVHKLDSQHQLVFCNLKQLFFSYTVIFFIYWSVCKKYRFVGSLSIDKITFLFVQDCPKYTDDCQVILISLSELLGFKYSLADSLEQICMKLDSKWDKKRTEKLSFLKPCLSFVGENCCFDTFL